MDDSHKYANLPIPTYEEATSSRPTSRGPEEISDDAERQGLLERGGYRPPTVESERSSEDSDLRLPEVTGEGDDARRQIEELDYLDPNDDTSPRQRGFYHRARLRSNFGKRLANISATFSSIRLPSFRSLYTPVSSGDAQNDDEAPVEPRTWRSRFTPQIQIPDQYRMSLPIFARLCGLFLIAAMIYVLFALDIFPGNGAHMGRHFNPEAVRQFVQNNVHAENIAGYLQHITSFDHVAGTEGDYYLATWMREQWMELGGFDDVALLQYFAYLNYPKSDGTGRSVQIVSPERKKWIAKLEEETIDPAKKQTRAWHGHSQSGEAKGHLIYANGGSREDFKWLRDEGVKTKGAIAMVRQGTGQDSIGLKIKAAEEAECAGVLVFSEARDDGAEGGGEWPDGPWQPKDSVQRGGVGLTSWVVGDPLTPGVASSKGAKRLGRQGNAGLTQIPSLPLAWRDAHELLKAIQGHGEMLPDEWLGAKSAGGWFSGGAGKDAPVVELRNHQDEIEKQRIWNLHGIIEGLESPAKKVVIGNHRDAWCFGAADPGSGSAVMMEVVSIFTKLRKQGWRPLRTIEFVSWDATEYNLIGSTEYVEDNIDFLRDNGVAYLNVGAGVYGPDFHASASPALKRALMHVLDRVSDPFSNNSLSHIWNDEKSALKSLDIKGDYVPFQNMAGMSSIDFGFKSEDHALPSHSCYDTFEWMDKFGDPGFQYHQVLAQTWALLILEIADRPLIPLDIQAYTQAMELYVKRLQQDAEQIYSRSHPGAKALDSKKLEKLANFTTKPLTDAIESLKKNFRTFQAFEDNWTTNVLGAGGLETTRFALKRLDYNSRLAHFETDLLDLPTGPKDEGRHGLVGREQYKHVLFGPLQWDEEIVQFAGVREEMDAGGWEMAMGMVERAAEVIKRAGEKLVE